MKLVYGPIPSRRLGQSLGIDTIPLKTCNWNCVYCQLGRSMPLVHARREYYPRERILAEVEQALTLHPPGAIDWVTFVGSGEPTLHSDIGWLIQQVQALTRLPVAIITNGSLLYVPEVRQALCLADAVLPSLDAGNAQLYRKINRPGSGLTFERLVEGLQAFRQAYHGQLWLEVMLVKELNDTAEALQEIASVLRLLQPDRVHLNLPIRPPAEPWVQAPDETALMRAQEILGTVAQVVPPTGGALDLSRETHLPEAILGLITRHPTRETELRQALEHWPPAQINEALETLLTTGQAQMIERHGHRFWSAAAAYYATAERSR